MTVSGKEQDGPKQRVMHAFHTSILESPHQHEAEHRSGHE
jgi:hypothetical protein